MTLTFAAFIPNAPLGTAAPGALVFGVQLYNAPYTRVGPAKLAAGVAPAGGGAASSQQRLLLLAPPAPLSGRFAALSAPPTPPPAHTPPSAFPAVAFRFDPSSGAVGVRRHPAYPLP